MMGVSRLGPPHRSWAFLKMRWSNMMGIYTMLAVWSCVHCIIALVLLEMLNSRDRFPKALSLHLSIARYICFCSLPFIATCSFVIPNPHLRIFIFLYSQFYLFLFNILYKIGKIITAREIERCFIYLFIHVIIAGSKSFTRYVH